MTNEELAERIKAGESALMADLWENCHKLLIHLMHQELARGKRAHMEGRGLSEEDLQQELYFALCKAVEGYKPEAGYKFTTYLDLNVKSVVDRALGLTKASDPLDTANSLDTPIADGEDATFGDFLEDPESGAAFAEVEEADYLTKLHADLEEALSELPERKERTIRARYLEDKTIAEIAESNNVSGETARRDEYEALMQLREAQALQSYRADIIEKYSYHSGLRSFRSNNFTSGVEIAAMRLVMEEDRMKKRAAKAAQRELDALKASSSTRPLGKWEQLRMGTEPAERKDGKK